MHSDFLVYKTATNFIVSEWQQDGRRLPDTHCDWVFNASEGSISSPDYWLPKRASCTYTFNVFSGNYMEIIIHIYGLK